MRLLKSFVLAAAMVFAISSTAQAQQLCPNPTAKVDSFNFMVDYSGSMMMHYSPGDIVYTNGAVASKEKIEMAKQLEKMKPFRGKFRKNERFYFLTNLLTKIKKSCNRTMIFLFLFTLNF